MLGTLSCALLNRHHQEAVQTPSIDRVTPFGSFKFFFYENNCIHYFYYQRERTLTVKLPTVLLGKGKATQVAQTPSGSCLQAPLIEQAGCIYPAAKGLQPEDHTVHAAQRSTGLHLLRSAAVWITNSSTCNDLPVRIVTLLYNYLSLSPLLLLLGKIASC